jgi:alcohol dehydrogenase (cytochrome c)
MRSPLKNSNLRALALSVTLLCSMTMSLSAQDLPDGPGKAVLNRVCTGCHGVDVMVNLHQTAAQWKSVVEDMISKGATLSAADSDLIVSYLAKNFGPERSTTEDTKQPAFTPGGVTEAWIPIKNYVPVTQKMLLTPDPADWLMYSRTYDAQRFSPLKEINRQNVGELRMAWSRGMGPGTTETIPIVHDGVMYVVAPGAIVQALDATNGDLLWQYKRRVRTAAAAASARTKCLAIYQDMILYTAPDGYVVALDARSGETRWQTYTGPAAQTSGPIVVDGRVFTGRGCGRTRDTCFIAAHDVATGKELWKFYTVPAPGEPGSETWGGKFLDTNLASTWGLPGTYDPVRNLLYWGVANPMPNTRTARHGSVDGTSRTTPSDLYSNSTLALDPATGKLKWYYQHLPGDDWDMDYTHERTLVTEAFNPDPKSLKWINPDVPRGQQRDMAVMVGEGGGIFALDRGTGQFLWANPFPYDTPNFLISDINPKTGQVSLNWDLVFKKPGDHHVICYYNTRSFWPTSFNPNTNSLYIAYVDNCLDMTAAGPQGPEVRNGIPRPGSSPSAFSGIAKVNLSTGEILRFDQGRVPGNGAVLTTAGDLVFHGDLNRRLRAFDANTGKQLWETIVGGSVSVSTITYAVKGKQYVAVMTGDSLLESKLLLETPELKPSHGANGVYVFALPDKR